MIYYIADMHFGHTNVLRFDNRPFSDTAQMDDTLIQNWKKNQRKFHAAKRGTWNGVSPVTRIVQSKRLYDRNRAKQESRQSADR